jgi:hypothetical protein
MPGDSTHKPSIVEENESVVARSLADGNFVQAYLLIHALIESLLRVVLGHDDDHLSFNDLINGYRMFLDQRQYPIPEFVEDLVKFNRRRNRIVHELWRKGFAATNKQTEPVARASVIMYGLLIEWFGTFDDSIGEKGFHLSE